MDFSNIKFNCSDLQSLMSSGKENKPLSESELEKLNKIKAKISIGKVLTKTDNTNYEKFSKREEAQDKPFLISKTNETILKKIYSREKYGKYVQSISSDYTPSMINGTMSETKSLELLSEVIGKKIKVSKDTISNNVLKGKIDGYTGRSLYKANHVYEVKTATNYESFLGFLDTSEEKTKHYWQLMGYLAITGAKSGSIVHCCVSYHPNIITSEINKYLYKIRGLDISQERVDSEIAKIRNNLTFDEIPKNERVIILTIDRNEEDIELINKRAVLFREWLNDFDTKMSIMNT